jgi:hypothetical protein
VTKNIAIIVINLVTPKSRAKHMPLFNEPASEQYIMLRWSFRCDQIYNSNYNMLGHTWLYYFNVEQTVHCTFLYLLINEWKSREALLKGKDQWSWPPCSNEFRSTTFSTEKIFFDFYKTTYLNEEAKCTEPSFSVRDPWKILRID